MIAVPTALIDIARAQAGVVTRAQLARVGITWSQARGHVIAQRWRAHGKHVVVLGNAPLTSLQRDWVAVLLPGKPAALAGLSAAAADGLTGFPAEQVHIVVRHATHIAAPSWVKIHESRRFAPEDIRPWSAPARTKTARSLIDAATWSTWPRRASSILCAGVQQRLVTVDLLTRELRTAGAVRHVAIMRDILGDIGGGGHTLAEIEVAPIAARAGLPPPLRQALRREPGGKVRWIDIEFVLPDGTILDVEIDGSAHQQTETWYADLDRQNEIVIDRRSILRFPSVVVRLDPDRVEDQLRRMRLAHSLAA